MILQKLGNLNVMVNIQMEFIFALHSLYKKANLNNAEIVADFDWIETPNIKYLNDLEKLIDINKEEELSNYLKYAWETCDLPSKIALLFDENFNLVQDKITPTLKNSFSYGTLEEFAYLAKKLFRQVDFSSFVLKYKDFYKKLLENDVKLFPNINIEKMIDYFGKKKNSYNYVISVLINGGFSAQDNYDNLYCIRGVEYNEEKKKFISFDDWTIESMFHEYSHNYINSLVDKNYNKFENLNFFLNQASEKGLPECYNNSRVLLYEYFVRAMARIFSYDYTNNLEISDFIKSHGFIHLQKLTKYMFDHYLEYQHFEDFFEHDLIDYFNELIKNDLEENYKMKKM